jgi:hypothetical protein
MRLLREGHPNAAFLTYERLLKAAGILEDDSTADLVGDLKLIRRQYPANHVGWVSSFRLVHL